MFAELGFGHGVLGAATQHAPVVGPCAAGYIFKVRAVGCVEHGVEGVDHGGAEGVVGVAAVGGDVEVVVAVGVDAGDGVGIGGGGDGGRDVCAVVGKALPAVLDGDGGGGMQRCPRHLHTGGCGGKLHVGHTATPHIEVVDIVGVAVVDGFESEGDVLAGADIVGEVDTELLPFAGGRKAQGSHLGVGGGVVGVVHNTHVEGIGAGGVVVGGIGKEGHDHLLRGAKGKRGKREVGGGVGGGV